MKIISIYRNIKALDLQLKNNLKIYLQKFVDVIYLRIFVEQ